VRGAQDGAQLREEQLRFGQAVADRAQAQCRVGLDAFDAAQRLVGADVERADGDRSAAHRLHHAAVGLELLVLVRQLVATEEQEFGAIQADTRGVDVARLRDVAGLLDVRLERYGLAVQRFGAGGFEALELAALEFQLGLAQPVLGEHLLVRIDDHHAARAVDDHQILVLHQLAHVVHADDRRYRHAARHDRGVRGGATQVGGESGDLQLLEVDRVGRRQVVRHDDRRLVAAAPRSEPARLAEQGLHHALDHLHDVVLAFAQVGILDHVELRDQFVHLLYQRPFGIAAPLGDDLARHLAQHRVGQDHHVQVDERTHLGRCTDLRACLEVGKFAAHGGDGVVEACDFGFDLLRRHRVVRDLERGVRDELHPPDRDAGRDGQSEQGEAHLPTLLRRTCRQSGRRWHRAPPARPGRRSRS
jgi:hypothetical protein